MERDRVRNQRVLLLRHPIQLSFVQGSPIQTTLHTHTHLTCSTQSCFGQSRIEGTRLEFLKKNIVHTTFIHLSIKSITHVPGHRYRGLYSALPGRLGKYTSIPLVLRLQEHIMVASLSCLMDLAYSIRSFSSLSRSSSFHFISSNCLLLCLCVLFIRFGLRLLSPPQNLP